MDNKTMHSCYHVVEFLTLPYASIDRYVCVPHSWIRRWQSISEDGETIVVAIAYPHESSTVTDHLVRLNQTYSDVWRWNRYPAYLRYTTDSYDNAMHFIRTRNQNDAVRSRTHQELPGFSPTTSSTPVTPVSRKRPSAATLDPEHYEKRSTVTSSNVSHQVTSTPRQTRQYSTIIGGQSSNGYSESDRPRPSFEDQTENSQDLTTELTNPIFNAFCEQLNLLKQNLRNKGVYINSLRESHIEDARMYNILVAIVRKYFMSPTNISMSAPTLHKPAEVQVINDENPTIPLRRSSQLNILPPEYDPNDSRWTLRYRKFSTGLTEIRLYTRIHVNSKKLADCYKESRDCKSLAQKLMVLIFSDNALKVCAFADGRGMRPGLDAQARSVLYTLVEDYGRYRKWPAISKSCFRQALESKLQEFRQFH